jgi:poly-gamma-glutamate synthesis protein (capsule biosynthesis protein)
MANEISLGAVGDISLSITDGVSPFEDIKKELDKYDLLFGNLECSIHSDDSINKSVSLTVNDSNLQYLQDAGFDIINVANNHITDGSLKGLIRIQEYLSENDIRAIGVGNSHPNSGLVIMETEGVRLGFLGYTESIGRSLFEGDVLSDLRSNYGYFLGKRNTFYTPSQASDFGIQQYDISAIISDINTAKKYCDFLIVSCHYGSENVFHPTPKIVEESRKIADSGADVVLGHHPHVPQGIEELRGSIIAYSLGNFQFDPAVSMSPTSQSYILEITFGNQGDISYHTTPIQISEYNKPRKLTGNARSQFLRELRKLSEDIQESRINWRNWFGMYGENYLTNTIKSYESRIKSGSPQSLLELGLWSCSPFTHRAAYGYFWNYMHDPSLHTPNFCDIE